MVYHSIFRKRVQPPVCGYMEKRKRRRLLHNAVALPTFAGRATIYAEGRVAKSYILQRAPGCQKRGIRRSENEKSGGGLPIGVCEDMCLANTPYRRKITETRVFPLFFKSRGGTGGDRGSKASITSRRDPASPSSSVSTLSTR